MAHKCDGCRYKGEHQEMMFRPMGVCNRGANLVEAVQNYEAEKCPYKKTNGDQVRAMSDEELYDLFREIYNAGCDDATAWEWGNTFIWDEEWLKQPADGSNVAE